MSRIALVAPAGALRAMLVSVAAAGCVEIDADTGSDAGGAGIEAATGAASGESQLRQYAGAAVRLHGAAALAGWTPAAQVAPLAGRLAALGCAVVPLPWPRGADAPTLVAGSAGQRVLSPLVSTYGTVPYADVNPAWLAWASYVLMFGVMFGDVGDGLLLLAAAAGLRWGWPARFRRFRAAWPFVAGAGACAAVFGLLYGEFFGPTGVVPVLWLDPLDAAGAAAGGRDRPRRRAARRCLRARHGEPVAGGRLAAGPVRAVRNRRSGAVRSASACSRPGGRAGRPRWSSSAASSPWPRSGWRSPASWPRPAAAELASRRPASSYSTWSSGSARTSCRSPGWPRSG